MAKSLNLEEALLSISEGLQYAARNPNIKHYKPHSKQAVYHQSRKKKKLYIGGNRSGKTTGGVCEDIWRASCTHPYRPDLNALGPTRGRVVAVDFVNGVEKIIFPQFKQWVVPSMLKGGSWENAYDKTLRTLTFTNGSTIEFMSYDQDLDKFAGTSRHWIHFDEEPPKSIYVECMARLIDTDGDFWITMTPVDGMTWVYDDLYEPNHGNEDSPVEIVEISMEENPYLSPKAIQSFVDSIDEDERTARITGGFVTVGGRIYKKFDPTTGGLHVLAEPVEHPKQKFKDWMWICTLDHGLNNPTAVLWIAVSRKGEVVVFWEHYKKEWTIDQHAAEILRINKFLDRTPDIYVADPSIQNRNAITNTSIHEEYIKYGIPFTLGNNDVSAGIVRVKKYFNPSIKPTSEFPLGRKPMLTIDPRCTNLIWELKRYRWKTYVNKKLGQENNAFEVPHKKDDHACDALRYAIMTRPDLVNQDTDKMDKVNEIMDNFSFTTTADDSFHIADPNALKEHPLWTEHNSIPKEHMNDGWEYDEHMGGIY